MLQPRSNPIPMPSAASKFPSKTVFKHPAGVIDPAHIPALKAKKSDDPGVVALLKITPLAYKHRALVVVDVGPYGAGKGHDEFVGDGEMTYKAAVAYLVTRNEAYARLAVGILDAWAKTCTTFTGSNGPLEAAWGTAAMARAAELLKHVWPQGWAAAGVEAHYVAWVDKLLYPLLTKRLGWDDANNWGLSRCEARLALAFLKDGTAAAADTLKEVAWVQAEYKRIHQKYVAATGQTGEWTRDHYHTQFGLGSLIQIPEMMWHQGVDLYSFRDSLMCKSMEFSGHPLIGKTPTNEVGSTKDVWYLPCGWHLAYRHYNGRKKIPMPIVAAVIAKYPREVFTFHWGLTSLTCDCK